MPSGTKYIPSPKNFVRQAFNLRVLLLSISRSSSCLDLYRYRCPPRKGPSRVYSITCNRKPSPTCMRVHIPIREWRAYYALTRSPMAECSRSRRNSYSAGVRSHEYAGAYSMRDIRALEMLAHERLSSPAL